MLFELKSSVTTHLYLSNFFFITASFHDILKRNGGDYLWQDQKNTLSILMMTK